ncbi:MAG: hypothetical protein CMJ31_12395 [Phycisphaerae bacterium]|nr:hypothetical protein [Phycisphaerae bacterium]
MSDVWTVYLAGEIHSDWRSEVVTACEGMSLRFTGPVTDHQASDDCGVRILGEEANPFWHDRKGAGVNGIRTRRQIEAADVVVARFGEKYRQWNTAFDAGHAVALGKPLITLHPSDHDHALKEIDAAAAAVCRTPDQVSRILRYVVAGS